MAKKSFKVWFPVYANVCDTVDLEESDIPSDQDELKEKLLSKVFVPSLCHQCCHDVELAECPADPSMEDVTFSEVEE